MNDCPVCLRPEESTLNHVRTCMFREPLLPVPIRTRVVMLSGVIAQFEHEHPESVNLRKIMTPYVTQ